MPKCNRDDDDHDNEGDDDYDRSGDDDGDDNNDDHDGDVRRKKITTGRLKLILISIC